MYVRREIRKGFPERVYAVVRNIMSQSAEKGRVMLYATDAWGTDLSFGLAASYAEPYAGGFAISPLGAGIVPETPIPPGCHGLLVVHGVADAVVFRTGTYNVAYWRNLIFYPCVTFNTDSTYGVLTSGLYAGGAFGTLIPNALVAWAKYLVPFWITQGTLSTSFVWLSMYVRMV